MTAMSHKTSKAPVLIGHRVRHRVDSRLGLVVGRAEKIGTRHALIPVTIETSTRTEYWPDVLIELLPKRQQFPAHGGQFSAPRGYPLHTT